MPMEIEVLKPQEGKKTKFGAVIRGVDVNNLSDHEVEAIREATWKHKVVIIKGQQDMQPIKQWELICRLDPQSMANSESMFLKDFHPEGKGILADIGLKTIPGAENVHIVGKGFQGEDHYGIKNLTMDQSFAKAFEYTPLTDEDLNRGISRFQGWHIDAAMYNRAPSLFTAFRIVRLPRGPDLTIRWEDGTGRTMPAQPGATPFFCCSQLYEELLSDDERRMADHSWVEYQAMPFEWTRNCRNFPDGLGLMSEGRELPESELARLGADWSKSCKYPMVWVNPLTKRKSFVVIPGIIRKLFIRRSPDEEPTVISDVEKAREFVLDIERRILRPDYILVPREEDGDLIVWDNCTMMHTRVDYPDRYGPKTCHQSGTNTSSPPVGPVPLPAYVTAPAAAGVGKVEDVRAGKMENHVLPRVAPV